MTDQFAAAPPSFMAQETFKLQLYMYAYIVLLHYQLQKSWREPWQRAPH